MNAHSAKAVSVLDGLSKGVDQLSDSARIDQLFTAQTNRLSENLASSLVPVSSRDSIAL